MSINGVKFPGHDTCIWFLQESESLSELNCSGYMWVGQTR